MKITKAIIPAAGLGTRVLPASKSVPKEMLNIVDKPAIQYIVEEAVAAGITDILVITNRGKSVIEDHFDHSFELEASLKDNPSKKKIYDDVLKRQASPICTISGRRRQRDLLMRFRVRGALSAMSRLLFFTAMTLLYLPRVSLLSVSLSMHMTSTVQAA